MSKANKSGARARAARDLTLVRGRLLEARGPDPSGPLSKANKSGVADTLLRVNGLKGAY